MSDYLAYEGLRQERDALRAQVADLRRALKPLAALELWTDTYPDGPLKATHREMIIEPEWVVAARFALETSGVAP